MADTRRAGRVDEGQMLGDPVRMLGAGHHEHGGGAGQRHPGGGTVVVLGDRHGAAGKSGSPGRVTDDQAQRQTFEPPCDPATHPAGGPCYG
jgi:hypothetical protein